MPPISDAIRRGDGLGGLSLLELVLSVVIIAVLIGVALDRLDRLTVQAEEVSVLQVEGTLKSNLGIVVAHTLAHGDTRRLLRLQNMNPMALLAQPPRNYLGVLDHPDPARIAGGHWYFDRTRHVLVYRVSHAAAFHDALGSPARAEYRITLEYQKRAGDRHDQPQIVTLYGVVLKNLAPYHWTP